ncbi:hypothetical protein [Intestinibacter sp.]|uniref:hypothetical protein n=1 Tax=Intestinibacter sp. TaxID=1965304 RepID=UPI003F13F97B
MPNAITIFDEGTMVHVILDVDEHLAYLQGSSVTGSSQGGSGVSYFNGRQGAVDPMEGDYTAEMVGAAPSIHASQHASDGTDPITPESIGAAAVEHSHDDVYAAIDHDHDGVYAPYYHTHDADGGIGFNQDDADKLYAAIDHTHTAEEIGAAAVDHTHTLEELGAAPAEHTHTLGELSISITPEEIGAASVDHTHTAEEIGAATVDHTHTAVEVGAASADHTHTATEIGAALAEHTHTASEIGALTQIEADSLYRLQNDDVDMNYVYSVKNTAEITFSSEDDSGNKYTTMSLKAVLDTDTSSVYAKFTDKYNGSYTVGLQNIAEPINDTDAATKIYVDDALATMEPTYISQAGDVSITIADNTEYTLTSVTSLNIQGNAKSSHGIIYFGSSISSINVTGFLANSGDDITTASAGETWEFDTYEGLAIWKNWSV